MAWKRWCCAGKKEDLWNERLVYTSSRNEDGERFVLRRLCCLLAFLLVQLKWLAENEKEKLHLNFMNVQCSGGPDLSIARTDADRGDNVSRMPSRFASIFRSLDRANPAVDRGRRKEEVRTAERFRASITEL